MRILLVDDDEALMESLAERLIHQRYAVDIAVTGSSAQSYLDLFNYDLVVLDLMLPDGDGIEFCQQFRAAGYANPLMILTAKERTAEKVRALDAGADDYVVKPFDFDELCARIRALLRRDPQGLPPILQWGALTLDPNTYETTFGQQPVRLTPKEFSMLELFLRHPHRVYSLGSIIDDLWSLEDPPGDDAIRTHIKGLRRKLQAAGAPKDLIKTVYGLGYRLNENVAWPPLTTSSTPPSTPPSTVRTSPTPPSIANTSAQPATQPAGTHDHRPQTQSTELPAPWCQSWYTSSPLPSGPLSSALLSSPLDASQSVSSYFQNSSGKVLENHSKSDESLVYEPSDMAMPLGTAAALRTGLLPGKLAQACKRYLRTASQQISVLEEVVEGLRQGTLDSQLHRIGQMNAHKLAGSMGSFGIPEGSRIARELETQLRAISMFSTSLSPQEIAPLGALVEQLRKAVDRATVKAAAQAVAASVQAGTPRLLIVSADEVLSQQLTQVTAALTLQSQVVTTPQQAEQLFLPATTTTNSQIPDLLLFDIADDPAPFTALIERVKQDYTLPVVVLEANLPLAGRLALVNQGVELVSDRNALPPQIIESAMGVLQASTRHVQVAITDDDPQMLALLKTSLEPWGFAVNTFESALELWHWLTEPRLYPVKDKSVENDSAIAPSPPEPSKADILVLDIEMPEMTGIELCRVLRTDARFQTLPILFLTVHQESALRMQAFQAGADDFVDKTVAPAELATRLRNQLARACRLYGCEPLAS